MDDEVEEKLQSTGCSLVEVLFRYLTAGAKGKSRHLSVMIADQPAHIIRYLSNINLDRP